MSKQFTLQSAVEVVFGGDRFSTDDAVVLIHLQTLLANVAVQIVYHEQE